MVPDMYPGPKYGGYSSPEGSGGKQRLAGDECPGNVCPGYISRTIGGTSSDVTLSVSEAYTPLQT